MQIGTEKQVYHDFSVVLSYNSIILMQIVSLPTSLFFEFDEAKFQMMFAQYHFLIDDDISFEMKILINYLVRFYEKHQHLYFLF